MELNKTTSSNHPFTNNQQPTNQPTNQPGLRYTQCIYSFFEMAIFSCTPDKFLGMPGVHYLLLPCKHEYHIISFNTHSPKGPQGEFQCSFLFYVPYVRIPIICEGGSHSPGRITRIPGKTPKPRPTSLIPPGTTAVPNTNWWPESDRWNPLLQEQHEGPTDPGESNGKIHRVENEIHGTQCEWQILWRFIIR